MPRDFHRQPDKHNRQGMVAFPTPIRRAALASLTACAALVFPAAPSQAQRALGPGDDAWIPPKGILRVSIGGQWSRARDRYSDGSIGADAGELEPLGAMFGPQPLDVALRRDLAPLQQDVRLLSGLSAFTASLGQTTVDVEQMVSRTPITLELGVTRRLSVGITVPYMMAQREVIVNTNPLASGATLGLNPARSVVNARLQNGAVNAEFGAAITQLQQRIATCQATPGASGCSAIVADPAGAQQLLAAASAYRGSLLSVFGNATAQSGAEYVPLAGSAAFTAIGARITQLDQAFQSFLVQATPLLATRPFASQNAVTQDDFQNILRDPAYGIEGDALKRVTRYGIGDVEIGGMFLLLDPYAGREGPRLAADRFATRLAVGALVRLGTGKIDSPDNFGDIGSGDQQQDVEIRGVADLIFGARGWVSVAGRYGIQMADERLRRVPEVLEQAITPLDQTRVVTRDLGDYVALEVTPRWALNDYFQLAGQYTFARKAEDTYTARDADAIPGGPDPDASLLGGLEAWSQQRIGGGVSWSTVRAYQQRRTWLPMDVSALYTYTIAGGGLAPKDRRIELSMRIYQRMWGTDDRPPRQPRVPNALRGAE
jgi:hypothetical protein